MIYDVDHRTVFAYAQSVSISHHVVHLAPRARARQTCARSAIVVEPAPAIRHENHDYFGNPVTFLTVQVPHRELLVHARARILVEAGAPVAPDASPAREEVARRLETARDAETLDAYQYAFDSPYVASEDDVYDFARASFAPGRPVLAAAMHLTTRIFEEFYYQGAVTDVSTPVSEVLRTRQGVCQDFAHLEIACLHSHGLAARYVSGYLLTRPPDGNERLVGADASHAWISVWCPGIGWVEFDPTNNLIPVDEHITLAWGRDYGDVSPINGFIVGGGDHEVTVAVDVVPVPAAPT